MWRSLLITLSLLMVLLGTIQMDVGSRRSLDEGQHASLLNAAVDLDCSEKALAGGSGHEAGDCCIAAHCAQCLVIAPPVLLLTRLGADRDSEADFGSTLLRGRTILPETDPPKLV